MENIFGDRFTRVKALFGREQPADENHRARRRARLRTLLLVTLSVGLLCLAVAEGGDSAVGKAGKAVIVAALQDPLSLFAQRSPGERSGALLPIKPQRTAAAGPQERVLSTIREREPPIGLGPVEDNPVFPSGAPPAEDVLPGTGGDPGVFAGSPAGFGAPAPLAPFASRVGQPGPGGGNPGAPGEPTPPLVEDPGTPPGGGPPVSGPSVSPVPEPATWAMLILGFFAVGVALRRRERTQTGPAQAR